jgi:transcriptional regulator of arginine metabolism
MPIKAEGWQQRRAVIEEILRREGIHNQLELVARLTERGFVVTQSSVSRDLHEIGAIRVDGRYLPPDALGAGERQPSELADVAGFVQGIAAAGPYLLVVKTPPGIAPLVALSLDHANWPEVTGTVAGDDTFFIATAGRRQQARVEAKLAALVKGATHA